MSTNTLTEPSRGHEPNQTVINQNVESILTIIKRRENREKETRESVLQSVLLCKPIRKASKNGREIPWQFPPFLKGRGDINDLDFARRMLMDGLNLRAMSSEFKMLGKITKLTGSKIRQTTDHISVLSVYVSAHSSVQAHRDLGWETEWFSAPHAFKELNVDEKGSWWIPLAMSGTAFGDEIVIDLRDLES